MRIPPPTYHHPLTTTHLPPPITTTHLPPRTYDTGFSRPTRPRHRHTVKTGISDTLRDMAMLEIDTTFTDTPRHLFKGCSLFFNATHDETANFFCQMGIEGIRWESSLRIGPVTLSLLEYSKIDALFLGRPKPKHHLSVTKTIENGRKLLILPYHIEINNNQSLQGLVVKQNVP